VCIASDLSACLLVAPAPAATRLAGAAPQANVPALPLPLQTWQLAAAICQDSHLHLLPVNKQSQGQVTLPSLCSALSLLQAGLDIEAAQQLGVPAGGAVGRYVIVYTGMASEVSRRKCVGRPLSEASHVQGVVQQPSKCYRWARQTKVTVCTICADPLHRTCVHW